MQDPGERWLLLIHQIPPKPNYLRVKIGRRLQRLGAAAIKNSVYAMPKSEGAREHMEWVLREIVEGGGDGSICEARFVEGLSDDGVEGLFHAARNADYEALAEELRGLTKGLPRRRRLDENRRAEVELELARLKRRLAEIAAIDFFGAPGRETLEGLFAGIEERVTASSADPAAATASPLQRSDYRARTWVTRKGIHVDRMASAWLIRRFIDPEATFKFVAPKGYVPEDGELRFDMFDGEFTHHGDLCSFEVLLARMGIDDPALRPLAEIVHDIDLKDEKHRRPETAGFEVLIAAIALAHRGDEDRLARASAVLDDLYAYYQRKRG